MLIDECVQTVEVRKWDQRFLRPFVLLMAVGALLFFGRRYGAGDWIVRLREWIEELGVPGIFAFMGVYVIGVVAIVPGTALTLIAATLFGPVLGIVVVTVASTIGACISFFIARHFAADAVGRWINKSETFRQLEELISAHGSVMVAVTRLVPILPYNLLNYAFGLTRVSFWTFIFWSWVCMLPATAINVLSMDVIANAVSEGQVSWGLALILLISFVALFVLYRFARKKLDATLTSKLKSA